MDINHQTIRLVQDAMRESGVSTQAELSHKSGIAQSQISRLLNGKLTGLTLTEATWEAIFDALSPAIVRLATPDQLPRRDWKEYLNRERELAEAASPAGEFPTELREIIDNYSALPEDKRKIVNQIISSYLPPEEADGGGS